MKKYLLTAVLALLTVFSVSAGEWELLSIGFTETMPSDAATTTVCGFKLGVPICGGAAPVYGLEAAVFWSGTESVDGVKCSLIATGGNRVGGLQLALVNFAENVSGLQLGIFNSAKNSAFQLGLINHIENAPLPWLPILNVKF